MMTVAEEFSSNDLNHFVRALFEGGVESLPVGFADLDPVALVDAIVAERRSLGPRARVRLNGWSTTEALVANAVLAKLDQARRLLPGARFDDAWQAISLSLDFATWGNEPWSACLLPNGAVLFRSFQQVLAVEEQPFAELVCSPEELRAALEALAEVMLSSSALFDAEGEQVGATALADRCSVLHRSASALTWSSMLPKRFSLTGQTLIMLPAGAGSVAACSSGFCIRPSLDPHVSASRFCACPAGSRIAFRYAGRGAWRAAWFDAVGASAGHHPGFPCVDCQGSRDGAVAG